MIDQTHDAAATSWVERANGHADFPVQNLPFGIFSPADGEPRIGVAIGDSILDVASAAAAGLISVVSGGILSERTLNRMLSLPTADRRALRHRLFALLTDPGNRETVTPFLHEADSCTMYLPAAIGDYTDFYVGIHHANNVGALFRPDNPLLPNYKYVPIGYHGRASSIRPSGVPLVRPKGQRKAPDVDAPIFGPCLRLDYELELGVWIGAGNALGAPIPIADAGQHIAGFCLLNDWSARDVQAWEYQPLGPFLAKNFQSTISPWIVTAEALAPFRIAQPERPVGDPAPLPYLYDAHDQATGALAITLSAYILSRKMRQDGLPAYRLSEGPASNMYWTAAQIVAHHASNGCNLNPGDLLGTGTISAPTSDGYGSLLEITRGGKESLILPTEESRTFVEDGDEILLTATAHADGFVSIGFGECRAMVLPSK
ncbi:fumarylacetoacetase [Sphingomonas populi]|uniref:fumarylacetoacetase n=1 Tax=Sphingomonas populi TaxID=2484750 RepID=A0A4Q6Y2F0_9SPHN|nr:fumarylacetoacetase [Sphingomonas populi]RZF63894.1 fumarylacetoacetase [Sphingomonas populi]